MLPDIDHLKTKNTIRNITKNSMTLSTTNLTKNNNPTSSYYYKIKPTTKSSSAKFIDLNSYLSFNSNNLGNKSKIINNSTNNNINISTNNNSNFYENLYYYPPHKNNYSYANDLSSEVGLLYSDFNFNKAPSLKQNVSEIHRMIESRKNYKLRCINNLFYNSLCGNRIAKTNIDDYYYEGEPKDIDFQNQNFFEKSNMQRNNSCLEFIPNKNNLIKNEPLVNNNGNISTYNNKSRSINKYMNTGNSGSISQTIYEIKNIPDLSKDNLKQKNNTINIDKSNNQEESLYLPELQKIQNSFITNLNTKKMDFKISDCIYRSRDKNMKITDLEKNIYRLRIFQNFQKDKLNSMLDKKVYRLEKYIKHIESIFHKHSKIYKIYKINFQNYLRFLWNEISDKEDVIKLLNADHIKLEYDVDNLLTKNIDKQSELEKLIEIRNFLYRVKHKDEKIPDIDSTLYIESKKYLLAKCLTKLFENDNNITVIKFLNTIPQKIPDISNIDPKNFIAKNCPPVLPYNNFSNNNTSQSINDSKINKNNNKSNKSKTKKYKSKKIKKEILYEPDNENAFSSPEEFMKIITFLEDQNRFLLRQNENKRMLIETYKDELETCVPEEEVEIGKKLMAEIEEKEKYLLELKHKNVLLKEKFKDEYNQNLVNNQFKELRKLNRSDAHSSFADFKYFQTVNYNFQISRAKYQGLVFFKKLLHNFLNFLSLNYDSFTKEKFYSHINPDCLDEILLYSKDLEFNDRNYFLIYDYTLKILKLYEFICFYVLRKNKEYNSNKKNIDIIKKEYDKITNQRKLENSRTIRRLIENKRINGCKQLIEKWQKNDKYISRKVDNEYYKLIPRNASQDDVFRKRNKKNKNMINDEYKSLLQY